MAHTFEKLDERYIRKDEGSPLLQAVQQSLQIAQGMNERLSGFIASTERHFDQLDQRMSRLEADMHDIKDFVGKDKTRH